MLRSLLRICAPGWPGVFPLDHAFVLSRRCWCTARLRHHTVMTQLPTHRSDLVARDLEPGPHVEEQRANPFHNFLHLDLDRIAGAAADVTRLATSLRGWMMRGNTQTRT